MRDTHKHVIPDEVAGLRILAAADCYSPSTSGGGERAAREVYRRMAAAGAEIRILSWLRGAPFSDSGVHIRRLRGLDLSRLAGGHCVLALDALRATAQELRAFSPQVAHVISFYHSASLPLALLASRKRVPVVTTAQSGPPPDNWGIRGAVAHAFDAVVTRPVLRRSASLLPVSRAVAEYLERQGADPARIQIICNGVDHKRFDLTRPNVEGPRPRIVVIRRLAAIKGPQFALDAALELLERGCAFNLLFIGDGQLRSELETRVRKAHAEDSIQFAGQIEQVERCLSEAEIFVLPSLTEGLSLALLEAMSAGLLCVVSAIPPNLELIADGRNGLTFRPSDSGHLADVLARALTDPALRSRLAKEAQRDSLAYSWDRMAAETARALCVAAGRLPPNG